MQWWCTKYLTIILFSCVTQTKLYDLESQVRRGAAEKGAAEIKKNVYQDEIQRQKEHMEHMESLYKRQLEGTQNMCTQEKVHMKSNECLKVSLIRTWKNVNVESFFFSSRVPCRRIFPPVPKPYSNSKVNDWKQLNAILSTVKVYENVTVYVVGLFAL